MSKKVVLPDSFVDPYPPPIVVSPYNSSFSLIPVLDNVTDNAKFTALVSFIGILLSALIRKYL